MGNTLADFLAKTKQVHTPQTAPTSQPVTSPLPSSPPPFSMPVSPAIPSAAHSPVGTFNQDQKAQKIRDAMRTASIGGKRNELPEGTGWFLIKEGMYRVTPSKGKKLTSFTLYCLRGVSDGQGLSPASAQYTGPRYGESYEYAVFHESDYPSILGQQYLQICAACMGWPMSRVEEFQKTEAGFALIMDMTARILCVDANGIPVMENGVQAPCIVANQAVIEISKKTKMKDKKVNNVPVYDATGRPLQVPVTNVYWNKRIWMDEINAAGVFANEQEIVKAFGSMEAVGIACELEAQFRQM